MPNDGLKVRRRVTSTLGMFQLHQLPCMAPRLNRLRNAEDSRSEPMPVCTGDKGVALSAVVAKLLAAFQDCAAIEACGGHFLLRADMG